MSCSCFFVSDLHGRIDRYNTLFEAIADEKPAAVFLGGDLLPHHWSQLTDGEFISDVLVTGFDSLRETLGQTAPELSMPVVTMVSYSIVYRYGLQRYVAAAKAAGAAGAM